MGVFNNAVWLCVPVNETVFGFSNQEKLAAIWEGPLSASVTCLVLTAALGNFTVCIYDATEMFYDTSVF